MAADIPQKPDAPTQTGANIAVMGSGRCDNAAMIEALRVIGLDAHDKPLNGVSEHFEVLDALLPQLRDTAPGALNGRNALLDQKDASGKVDGKISGVELAAALIAASEIIVKHGGGELKDVPVQEIINGMCTPLQKLRHEAPQVCKTR